MRLASSYTFGPTIRAAVLPPPNYVVPDRAEMFVTGWGSLQSGSNQFPNILQGVNIPKWTNADCDAAYPRDPILDQHICGGAVGRDSCQGDSGGPVTFNGFQVGIVSWGKILKILIFAESNLTNETLIMYKQELDALVHNQVSTPAFHISFNSSHKK